MYLGSTILAEGEQDIRGLDYTRILEQAFLLRAVAYLLVRKLPKANPGLSRHEIAKAVQLHRLGERVDLFLFDYIVIEGETESGLFAVNSADRFRNVI